ncbi:hypothetical protein GP486_002938 [Trichoglossum hirsutum]|uniref:Protein N-terminal glutamine amidohydrolase n=1 Tax=Trichoglossum hirsutum TaxID=265104 RepID=A0A9P8LE10_9PEZI|nr:hypothetical protein GP486_002938 [Trichoglossum hirsutum]
MARGLSTSRIRGAPRSFRVIPAMEYLRNFSSDRSHMRKANSQGKDEWASPPPPYPPIINENSFPNVLFSGTAGDSNTFPYYRDFKSKDCEADPMFGRIIDQPAFLKKFGIPSDEGFMDLKLTQPTRYGSRRLALATTTDEERRESQSSPNPDLQNKPQSVPPERELTKLRSDDQNLMLICQDCGISRFSDLAQFNEHCRTKHNNASEDDDEQDMSYVRITRRGSSGQVTTQDQEFSRALDPRGSRMPIFAPKCAQL